jgi:hypothetical protein
MNSYGILIRRRGRTTMHPVVTTLGQRDCQRRVWAMFKLGCYGPDARFEVVPLPLYGGRR